MWLRFFSFPLSLHPIQMLVESPPSVMWSVVCKVLDGYAYAPRPRPHVFSTSDCNNATGGLEEAEKAKTTRCAYNCLKPLIPLFFHVFNELTCFLLFFMFLTKIK